MATKPVPAEISAEISVEIPAEIPAETPVETPAETPPKTVNVRNISRHDISVSGGMLKPGDEGTATFAEWTSLPAFLERL